MNIKLDDIITVSMEFQNEVSDKFTKENEYGADNYDRECHITYQCENKAINVEYPDIVDNHLYDNIEEYLEESLKEDFPMIDEYEIFDVDIKSKKQTAKIKIVSIKKGT